MGIADAVGFSPMELYDFAIMYLEYREVGSNQIDANDLVESVFDGFHGAHAVIEVLNLRAGEIMACVPSNTRQMRMVQADREAIYVIATEAAEVAA